MLSWRNRSFAIAILISAIIGVPLSHAAWAADKPNILMLMTDNTGWSDFDAYSVGGAAPAIAKGWTVISMENDWKQIFASEK